MSGRRSAALAGLAACSTLALLSTTTGRASDHLDGPRATADPQADIADVFAFTSPNQPERLVLAMTITPFASAASRFSSEVDYVFRVRRVTAVQPLALDTTALDVICGFDDGSIQRADCSAPGGRHATVLVGDLSGGSAQATMPLFAGLRSDPSFFDRQGALATLASGRTLFTGQNAFAGASVLALVVEVDALAFAPPPDPDAGVDAADAMAAPAAMPLIVAVAAETVRRGP